MDLDDRAANREPHARAIRFGCVEGIEHVVARGRIKPRTGIPHFHEYIAQLASAGDDRQFARSVGLPAHRLDGVDDQIEDHLLQLDSVETGTSTTRLMRKRCGRRSVAD